MADTSDQWGPELIPRRNSEFDRAKRMSTFFLTAILGLTHWIVAFVIEIHVHVGIWWRKMFTRGGTTLASDVKARTKGLDKLPNHIALCILEDDMSWSDLANLIVWSAAAGAKYVSLYDLKGIIKRHPDKLGSAFQVAKAEADWSDLNACFSKQSGMQEENSSHSSGITRRNGKANGGHLDTPTVTISLLSLEDGKADIVRAARETAKRVQSNSLSSEEIDELVVTASLSSSGTPDPDMMVRCGRVNSTMGFLPWQIRLTEIHSLGTHKSVGVGQFMALLRNYSKCEKRFGK